MPRLAPVIKTVLFVMFMTFSHWFVEFSWCVFVMR